jgi:hypothetical protein
MIQPISTKNEERNAKQIRSEKPETAATFFGFRYSDLGFNSSGGAEAMS